MERKRAAADSRSRAMETNRRIRSIMLAGLLLAAGQAAAATYYVSPLGKGSGTKGSPMSLSAAAAKAVAGDTVILLEGTYRETVVPANSGTAEKPIIFRGVERDKVIISGTEPVKGWKVHDAAKGIYVADMAGDFFSPATPNLGVNNYAPSVHNQADQVFYGGRMMLVARWPNDPEMDLSLPKKARGVKFISQTPKINQPAWKTASWKTAEFSDPKLEGLTLENAEMYIQPPEAGQGSWSWTYSGWVPKVSDNKVTYCSRSMACWNAAAGRGRLPKDSRYYLFNCYALLDTEGEWYHGKKAGRLFFIPPGKGNPEGKVEAKKREFAFNLSKKSHIRIENLSVFGCAITTDDTCGGDGVFYSEDGLQEGLQQKFYPAKGPCDSTGVVLDGLNIKYPFHHTDMSGPFGRVSGIVLNGTGHVLANSTVQYSSGALVWLAGTGHRVVNNELYDANYKSQDFGFVGGNLIDGEIGWNTMKRVGKHGLAIHFFYSGLGARTDWKGRIHHNDISAMAIQDGDTGAIRLYRAGGDKGYGYGRVDHNYIHDSFPYLDNNPRFPVGCSGIYLDPGKHLIADHNIIVNLHIGMSFAHLLPANLITYNNTIGVKNSEPSNWVSPIGQFWWIGWNLKGTAEGSVCINNLYFPTDGSSRYVGNQAATGHQGTDFNMDAANNEKYNRTWGNNLSWDGVAGSATDPQFVDMKAGDYRLKKGSAAIDKGMEVPVYERKDNKGAADKIAAYNDKQVGKAVDIGAYEFGGEDWKAGVVAGKLWQDGKFVDRK